MPPPVVLGEDGLPVPSAFSEHVDRQAIARVCTPGTAAAAGAALGGAGSPTHNKPLKTAKDVTTLLQAGRRQDVKTILRSNGWACDSMVRPDLWPALCEQHSNGKKASSTAALFTPSTAAAASETMDGFYWDMVTQVFGSTDLPDRSISLPPFVEPDHCQSYYLSIRGRAVADRVVSVLGYACPDIVYSPGIYPICAMLLHFMTEEQCYNCMSNLVSSKEKMFITQTKQLYEVTWKTVMQICKKHVKAAAVHLQRHCPSNRIDRIYSDWIWWVLQELPFTHLVRVMDCFFHEGIKVLYRVAMAILVLFHKHSSTNSFDWTSFVQKNGIDDALKKFCRDMTLATTPPSKILKLAFGIRGLSSAYISRVFIRTEMMVKSKSVINGPRQLVKSRSTENLPNSQSQNNIQMVSHTLTIREGAYSPGPRMIAAGGYPVQNINSLIMSHLDDVLYHRLCKYLPYPNIMFRDRSRNKRDKHTLLTLWSWLPVRITMYQPILLYTTEEHGCSLTTFYVRVEQHEPTLLMIKTCNNEVFGAYCSSKWAERNMKDDRGNRQAYFGTGETFLFSLYPESAKYPWVGIESDKNLGHGSELFMAADSRMITIGGGEGQAIWMDENIRYGKTDHCQTFNNPPLCPSGDFEIRVLEVYGFSTEH